MSHIPLSKQIKEKATQIGFDLVGMTQANPHPDFNFFNEWIQKGYQAEMQWMVRGADKRRDPQKILKGAQSFICVGLNYYRGKPRSIESHDQGKGWISNYAWGEDYHEVVLKKLKQLEVFILEKEPKAKLKSYVDTGPILERSYAASAGLGWIGKNTCLIHKKYGSLFFLGEIITDLKLDYDQPLSNHCGTCSRCIEACPTQALKAYELDAYQCISYLTIEHPGDIDDELFFKIGHHLYGCDICQDVCPWNKKVPLSQEAAFEPRPNQYHPLLNFFRDMKVEDFFKRFKGSPMKRLGLERLMRNVRIVQKNQNEV